MRFIDLIAYRGFVIALNVVSLMIMLFVVVSAMFGSGSVGIGVFFPALAPIASIIAFATTVRLRKLLIAALIVNVLSLVVFSLGAALALYGLQEIPISLLAGVTVVVWLAPLVTITACILRLPRAVAT